MNKLSIGIKNLSRISNNPTNLALSLKGYRITGTQFSRRGAHEIPEFYIERFDEKFLEQGIQAFLFKDAHAADIFVDAVYENLKQKATCYLFNREARVIINH